MSGSVDYLIECKGVPIQRQVCVRGNDVNMIRPVPSIRAAKINVKETAP